jgi:ubiquinone/menaquinone biosynthesis C-methylase UbiE
MKELLLLPILSTLFLVACGPYQEQPESSSPSLLHPNSPASVTESYQTENDFDLLVSDYESTQRVIWQKPDLVIAQLGDLKGKTVADIGAGTGYFAFRLVPKAERVIAIDIDQRFINFMDSIKVRLPNSVQNRFETRLGQADTPLLKPSEADVVIVVNTYCYIENRVQYLKTLASGMKNNGELLIIDFKKNNLPVGPPTELKVSTAQVKTELEQAGFKVKKTDNQSLDYQYIIVATLHHPTTESN